MCRTVQALLQTVLCVIQMLIRVFMTIILMLENLIRMILQNLYNLISCLLQTLSLIPICCIFLLTSRLKCFMCGGGAPCPVNRGGACDCLVSIIVLVALFFIFRATGVLDKIFYKLGYSKALGLTKLTPGEMKLATESLSGADPTEESNEYYYQFTTGNLALMLDKVDKDKGVGSSNTKKDSKTTAYVDTTTTFKSVAIYSFTEGHSTGADTESDEIDESGTQTTPPDGGDGSTLWTTVLFYLV